MNRIDVINHIVSRKGFTKYLEIGVRFPWECFDHIQCSHKDGVDPGIENESNPVKYPFTSDDFFTRLESGMTDLPPDFKWDVVFVDGLHISHQVERDILNSLNHLSPDGYIVLHDCNPFLYEGARFERAIEDYWGQAWNGTVWKAIYKLLCSRSDLDVFTVNTDEGLGIIKRGTGRKLIEHTNSFYEYKVLQNNLNEHLNCISVDDFIRLIG
jgi:hypothetical protein